MGKNSNFDDLEDKDIRSQRKSYFHDQILNPGLDKNDIGCQRN